jgi:hypothetical protein
MTRAMFVMLKAVPTTATIMVCVVIAVDVFAVPVIVVLTALLGYVHQDHRGLTLLMVKMLHI